MGTDHIVIVKVADNIGQIYRDFKGLKVTTFRAGNIIGGGIKLIG